LLKFTSNFGGAFVLYEIATDGGLFFCQVNARMVKSDTSEVFQFTILTPSIVVEVVEGEEPSVNDTDPGDASCLNKVHKVPVTEV